MNILLKTLGAMPLLFFLVLVLPVSAQAPAADRSTVTHDWGMQIEHPYIEEIRQFNDYKFHFHIFNTNSSKPYLNTSGVVCIFHLYNVTGSHMMKVEPVLSDDKYDWEQIVKGNNFSNLGRYAMVFQCNNSIEGGYYENSFEVVPYITKGGNYNTTPKSDWRIFIILILLSLSLLTFSLYSENYIFSFFTGLLFSLSGVYTMIYGFDNIVDIYTRAIAGILLGVGIILTIISALELIGKDSGESGEIDEEE